MQVASLLRVRNRIKIVMYRVQRWWRCGLWWGVGEQSQAFGEAWRAETPGRCWWTDWRKTKQNKGLKTRKTVKISDWLLYIRSYGVQRIMRSEQLLASVTWCPSVFNIVSDTEGHWKKDWGERLVMCLINSKMNHLCVSLNTETRPHTQELKSSTTPWSLTELHLRDIFFSI